jgi:hypothetical protein
MPLAALRPALRDPRYEIEFCPGQADVAQEMIVERLGNKATLRADAPETDEGEQARQPGRRRAIKPGMRGSGADSSHPIPFGYHRHHLPYHLGQGRAGRLSQQGSKRRLHRALLNAVDPATDTCYLALPGERCCDRGHSPAKRLW